MISEVKVLLHVDDVVEVVFVFPLYYIQDLQLNQSLVVEPTDKFTGGVRQLKFKDINDNL